MCSVTAMEIVFLSLFNHRSTVGVYEELVAEAGERGGAWVNVRVHGSQRWNWLEYRSIWEWGCLVMRLFCRF